MTSQIFTARLPREYRQALSRLAEKLGISAGEVFRRMIEETAAEHGIIVMEKKYVEKTEGVAIRPGRGIGATGERPDL